MRITFAKHRSNVYHAPLMYDAKVDGKRVATIQHAGHDGLWFWYGFGRNTATRPVPMEEAKAQVRAAIQTKPGIEQRSAT